MSKAMDSAAPLPQPQAADEKETLQVTVQLTKRWRDLFFVDEPELAPVSVVLTTLLGNHYYGEQSISISLAESVDAILYTLPNVGRLIVTNPSHPDEDLSERWDKEEAYQAFVYGMRAFRGQLRELMACTDMGKRSAMVQVMFDETLAKTAFAQQASAIQEFRDAQRMRLAKSAAGVVSLSATATSAVPRNTFYGEAES